MTFKQHWWPWGVWNFNRILWWTVPTRLIISNCFFVMGQRCIYYICREGIWILRKGNLPKNSRFCHFGSFRPRPSVVIISTVKVYVIVFGTDLFSSLFFPRFSDLRLAILWIFTFCLPLSNDRRQIYKYGGRVWYLCAHRHYWKPFRHNAVVNTATQATLC